MAKLAEAPREHLPINLYSTDPADAQDPAVRKVRADLSSLGTVDSIDGLISTTQTQGLVVEGATATLSHEVFTTTTVIDVGLDEKGELCYSNHGRARATFTPPAHNAYEGLEDHTRFRKVSDSALTTWEAQADWIAEMGDASVDEDSATDKPWFFGWTRVFVSGLGSLVIMALVSVVGELLPDLGESSPWIDALGVAYGMFGVLLVLATLLVFVHMMLIGNEEAAYPHRKIISASEAKEKNRMASELWDSSRDEIFREGFANAADLSIFLEGLMALGQSRGIRRMSRFSLVESKDLVVLGGAGDNEARRIFRRSMVTFLGTAPRRTSLVNYVFDGTNIFRYDLMAPKGTSAIFIP